MYNIYNTTRRSNALPGEGGKRDGEGEGEREIERDRESERERI